MSTTKHHTIKLTDKQLESYVAAVKCFEQLGDSPVFYNSIRIMNPNLRANDMQIKRELIDPLTKSLSKISTVTHNTDKKKTTNFNKQGKISGIIREIYDNVSKHENADKYITDGVITTTQLRLLFKRYLILNKMTVAGGSKCPNSILEELSETVIGKMYKENIITELSNGFHMIPSEKLNSFTMRLCIGLCSLYPVDNVESIDN